MSHQDDHDLPADKDFQLKSDTNTKIVFKQRPKKVPKCQTIATDTHIGASNIVQKKRRFVETNDETSTIRSTTANSTTTDSIQSRAIEHIKTLYPAPPQEITTKESHDGISDLSWSLDPFENMETDNVLNLADSRLERHWYNMDETDAAGGDVDLHAFHDDSLLIKREEKLHRHAPTSTKRISQKARQRAKQQELWETSRLFGSGVGGRRVLDEENLTGNDEQGVHVMVRSLHPSFLPRNVKLGTFSVANVFKDETSDMAVLAKRGSAIVKTLRESEDRQRMRQRFWELQGSNMGQLLGIKGGLKYTGVEEDDDPNMAFSEALKAQRMGVTDEAKEAKYAKIQKQRQSLPVYECKEPFLENIKENPILIVVGETGSGKTTQLTQYLHEAGYTKYGMVACSQPRRVAAVSVAQRVAEEMNTELGDEVGYSIRFEDVTSANTKIKYLTDGVLLREVLTDRILDRYSCVIMDEAHERSLNTDVLFGVLKRVSMSRRDFKLIVTSATLDSNKFASFFGDAPIFSIPGRTFPVSVEYLRSPCADYVDTAVQKALQIHCNASEYGDILVFMTGREDIEMTCLLIAEKIKKLGDKVPPCDILPIYSNMPQEMQARVFGPTEHRKIIVATNIAETSLTLDQVKYVLDAGYQKLKVHNPGVGLDTLMICPVSQAAARQRAGRAGRTGPGICHRLYTERAFLAELYEVSIPEIQRTNLSKVVLSLKSLGIESVLSFDFMDHPGELAILNAMYELWVLGALDDAGEITEIGEEMVFYPVDPPLAKTTITARKYKCMKEILIIVSLLSVPPIYFRPRDRAEEADAAREKFYIPESDHLTLLNTYEMWERHGSSPHWAASHYLHHKIMKKAQEVRSQMQELISSKGVETSSEGDHDIIRKTICAGYFHHGAKLKGIGEYCNLRSSVTCYLHPSSALYASGTSYDYIVYHEVTVTTREFVNHATAVEANWLAEEGPVYYYIKYTNT